MLQQLLKNYFNQTNFKSRGIKSRAGTNGDDYYHVIRESNMPAIIIEHGFMDNKSDLDKLRAVNGMQHKLARLTVEAISGACAIRDITNTLNNLMKEFEKKHANNKPQNTIARLADFYFTVRNGSEGDYRRTGYFRVRLLRGELDERRRLIDSFVNSVTVFDDYILITFNYKEGEERLDFTDIESSDLQSVGGPIEASK